MRITVEFYYLEVVFMLYTYCYDQGCPHGIKGA